MVKQKIRIDLRREMMRDQEAIEKVQNTTGAGTEVQVETPTGTGVEKGIAAEVILVTEVEKEVEIVTGREAERGTEKIDTRDEGKRNAEIMMIDIVNTEGGGLEVEVDQEGGEEAGTEGVEVGTEEVGVGTEEAEVGKGEAEVKTGKAGGVEGEVEVGAEKNTKVRKEAGVVQEVGVGASAETEKDMKNQKGSTRKKVKIVQSRKNLL